MFKTLLLTSLFLSPLLAQEASQKPRIIIEEAHPIENGTDVQYNIKDKITNMLFSLGVIIVAVGALIYALKKLTRKRLESINAISSIKVLEKRTLTSKTHLYVIEAYNKTLLIGESPEGLVTLSELSPGLEDLPTGPAPLSFTQVLKKKFENIKS